MEAKIRKLTGPLRKMATKLNGTVEYSLAFGDETLRLNDYLGREFSLRFLGEIHCIQCGRLTKKSFQSGYCFPCYQRLLECNMCMLHPERCLFYEGQCDPNDWAHAHCTQKQYVYLANSSGLKVGITREAQMPTRWFDQGAIQGLAIYKVQNRYQAGLIEVALKDYVQDKTNWRVMLKGGNVIIDLIAARQKLLQQAEKPLAEVCAKYPGEMIPLMDEQVLNIEYPVLEYPEKITSKNFDKTPEITGKLMGIKGQYLLLDQGVLNIRKFGGYEVEVCCG